MKSFVGLPELAEVAGVSERALEKAVVASRRHDHPWRGATLVVRTVRGRGGRSGLRYEVLVSSLPIDLQERLKGAVRTIDAPRQLADGRGAERDWWNVILHPARIHPKGSRGRGAAIADILSRAASGHLTDWCGRPIKPSRRTIERKLEALDLHGLAGITPKHRCDKGAAKVLISMAWDKAVPFDTDDKVAIAGCLREYLRGLYKAGFAIGRMHQLGAQKLNSLTATYLGKLSPQVAASAAALPDSVFKLPRAFIEAERKYREVAIHRKDHKFYEDARKPRIQRTSEGMEPMEVVVGDVHHLDIVMRREDGSEVWPKAIAWFDHATHRIRMDLVLLGKGEGIRNADVIRSFINMTQDPTWGMPRTLYLDNGSEYRWADFADDAMKLIAKIDHIPTDRSSQIIRAKPYNAAAKAIEGIFGILEQHHFNTVQGWTGGDRTNKKTARVGRRTQPFADTFDEFSRTIGYYIGIYENAEQRGDLKGASPAAAYRSALDAGWQRTTLDPRELATVFAVSMSRKVNPEGISWGGRTWYDDALIPHIGEMVTIRVPKFEEPASVAILPVLDASGALIGFAASGEKYAVLDPAGARESDRRAKLHRQGVRELDRSAPDIDAMTEMMKLAKTFPALPSAPIAGTISVNNEIAAGMAEAPEERADRRREMRLRKDNKRTASLDRIHERLMGGLK